MATDWVDPYDGWTAGLLVTANHMILYIRNQQRAIAKAMNRLCQARLTLTSGTPVTTGDVTGAATLYCTPCGGGNGIALYNVTNARWELHYFAETSLGLGALSTDTNYDIFGYDVSGTFTLEAVAWTNATTRATAITLQDGVYVKSGSANKRYLGTIRTSGAGTCEDSAAKRFVWNYYNRVRRALRVLEGTDSWNYTTATIRQANGSTANQVETVVGVAESLIDLRVYGQATNGTAGTNVAVGIGQGSTTAFASGSIIRRSAPSSGDDLMVPEGHLVTYPAIGYQYWAWLEWSVAAGTTTWYGDGGAAATFQSGMHGTIHG